MSRLRAFLALDAAEKLATLEAVLELIRTNILVRLVPPRRWRSRFGSMARNEVAEAMSFADVAVVRRIRLAISRAMLYVPSPHDCLPQALAARSMLRRRRVPASLYIGTKRDTAGTASLHAWLKVGEEWVTGLCDESLYTLTLPGDAGTA